MHSFHGQDINLAPLATLQSGERALVMMNPLRDATEPPLKPDWPSYPGHDHPDHGLHMESYDMPDLYTAERNSDPSAILSDDESRLTNGFDNAQTEYHPSFFYLFPELFDSAGQCLPLFPEVAEMENSPGSYWPNYAAPSNAIDATGDGPQEISLLPAAMATTTAPSMASSFPHIPAESSVPGWPWTHVPWGKPCHGLVETLNWECAHLTTQDQTAPTNTVTASVQSNPIIHNDGHFYPPFTTRPATGQSRQLTWRLQDGATVNGPLAARHTTVAERVETRAIRQAGGACDTCKAKRSKCDLSHVLGSTPSSMATRNTSRSTSSGSSSFVILTLEDAMP